MLRTFSNSTATKSSGMLTRNNMSLLYSHEQQQLLRIVAHDRREVSSLAFVMSVSGHNCRGRVSQSGKMYS